MDEKDTILLVDDSDDDSSLMRRACRAAQFKAPLQAVKNGEEALAYLNGKGIYADRGRFPLPTVLLLDLNMPKVDGFDMLKQVRAQSAWKNLLVILLTSSQRSQDVELAFELGANSCLVKPATLPGLISMICCMRDWFDYNVFPLGQSGLVKKQTLNPIPRC